MQKKTPYRVIQCRYITEKSRVLEDLKDNKNNPCVAKCESPKYAFLVDKGANKREIADAVEQIYAEKNIKVKSVNTITMKPKKKRVRGREGFKAGYKKAIVTLDKGDHIGEGV